MTDISQSVFLRITISNLTPKDFYFEVTNRSTVVQFFVAVGMLCNFVCLQIYIYLNFVTHFLRNRKAVI